MAAATYEFGDLSTTEGVEMLNKYLQSCSYLSGPHPTKDDLYTAEMLNSVPSSSAYPHACRWYTHITQFNKNFTKTWPNGKLKAPLKAEESSPKNTKLTPKAGHTQKKEAATAAPKAASKVEAKPQADDDDDFDVFGDDDGDAEEAAKQLKEKREAEKAKQQAKPEKAKRIDKSSLVIEIKPYDDTVDLDHLKDLIWQIQIEGVTWGEAFSKVPLAYGLYKLHVNCTIIDELVDTDGISEAIEILGMSQEAAQEYVAKREAGTLDDDDDDEDEDEENTSGKLVQSAEIVAFNKL